MSGIEDRYVVDVAINSAGVICAARTSAEQPGVILIDDEGHVRLSDDDVDRIATSVARLLSRLLAR